MSLKFCTCVNHSVIIIMWYLWCLPKQLHFLSIVLELFYTYFNHHHVLHWIHKVVQQYRWCICNICSLVRIHGDGYWYATRGNKTLNFWKFSEHKVYLLLLLQTVLWQSFFSFPPPFHRISITFCRMVTV